MTKQSFLMNYPFLFFIILSLLVGCNNDKTPVTEPTTPDTSKTTTAAVIQPTVATFSGLLDTLYVADTTFNKLDKHIVIFVFTLQDKDVITMHGWGRKEYLQGEFPPDPSIKLLQGKPSGLSYGPGTYFGNVILNDVKKIKKMLKDSTAKYVLFAPKKIGEHIGYEIFLSKEDPQKLVPLLGKIPTNVDVNPSPPKQY